jgi:excinuclease UvrABC ATPase subunit
VNGGKITFNGTFDELIKNPKSITGKYFNKSTGIKNDIRNSKNIGEKSSPEI